MATEHVDSLHQISIYCKLQPHIRSKKQLDEFYSRFDPNSGNTAESRKCERCKIDYTLRMDSNGVPEPLDKFNLCEFHTSSVSFNKFPDEYYYACCNGYTYIGRKIKPCKTHNYHVSENPAFFKNGIVSSASISGSNKVVYALDCEMCATVNGYECCQVTLLDEAGKVVYESLVKPEGFILDYETELSGITKETMENGPCKSLKEVQNDLLKFIKEDTILMGYGINDELTSLKLHHDKLINSVIFETRQRHRCISSVRELAKNIFVLESLREEMRREKKEEASCTCVSWRNFKTIFD
ncbi:Hypothetical predicted protein [Cloeon dipterum]|uniref:Exonuclease domain-containing protein n=1 Tax=Cloeon dipterum TaxID=197152 RepID=A0A8S1DVB6_9INSE|nr:Hypothetical predicted protein [Cloeon dipterum]